jgi:hypothetical protein
MKTKYYEKYQAEKVEKARVKRELEQRMKTKTITEELKNPKSCLRIENQMKPIVWIKEREKGMTRHEQRIRATQAYNEKMKRQRKHKLPPKPIHDVNIRKVVDELIRGDRDAQHPEFKALMKEWIGV